MERLVISTPRLDLALQSPDEALARVAALPEADRAEVSPDWIARMRATPAADSWSCGFRIVERASGAIVGDCAFKGPPDAEGVVELAYAIEPNHRRRGFASEAALALTKFALASGRARVVRAHTKPDGAASRRVLVKCGFQQVGEIVDAEDGLVLRWELERSESGDGLAAPPSDDRS